MNENLQPCKLLLTNSTAYAFVSAKDYERCAKLSWNKNKQGYAQSYFQGERVLLHRFVLWMFDDDKRDVDHRDDCGTNCVRSNLRVCTTTQNTARSRKRKGTSSKFKGVTYSKTKQQFRARITMNKKQIHLGYFNTEIEAACAYDSAAKIAHGEFARLNQRQNKHEELATL